MSRPQKLRARRRDELLPVKPRRMERDTPAAGEAECCLCPRAWLTPGRRQSKPRFEKFIEETGLKADAVTKLADSKYVYTRTWGDGRRVFKIVSFYLMRYRSGRINDIAPAMRIEVARARWVRLEDAPKLLAYTGEKQMARRALEYLKAHAEL